jgi:hypothetical protein
VDRRLIHCAFTVALCALLLPEKEFPSALYMGGILPLSLGGDDHVDFGVVGAN